MIRGIAAAVVGRFANWLAEGEEEADELLPGRPDLLRDGYLIQRQVEQIAIEPDRMIESRLSIHLTLPPEASEEGNGADEATFLIPLMFVPKAGTRLGLTVLDEAGASLPVLSPHESDRFTAAIAAAEIQRALQGSGTPPPASELEEILRPAAADAPLQASMAVAEILERMEERLALVDGEAWARSGIRKLLLRLVEHSVVWVELKGAAGERRVIAVSRRMPLTKRSALSWRFGRLRRPRRLSLLRPIRSRRFARGGSDRLQLGESVYGRLALRVSLSALWDRAWRWLALRPTDFEISAAPASRGDLYELELRCPAGLTPRGLRVFISPLPEPGHPQSELRTTLTADTAQLRLVRRGEVDGLSLRFTVGLSPHTVLALWWLACSFAAGLLWAFASVQPDLADNDKSIAGALFIAGFSFLAAQAAKAWTADFPLPGVALILLLCAADVAAGALVLIGARPFELEESWTWSICAFAATLAATVLLVAWLLTRDATWSALGEVASSTRRRLSELALIACAMLTAAVLLLADPAPPTRAAAAILLLALAVCSLVLASHTGASRLSRIGSPLLAGTVCLLLGCVELRGALVYTDRLQTSAEQLALLYLAMATFLGSLLSFLTSYFRPAPGEVVVSPEVGRAIVAGERLHELQVLRSREVRVLG